ncbi:hypothetical protein BGL34_03610 [Fructilactobacillus lindneri]|uniref:Muramidase n=2 Tax=Fructilactobacillus lindneri TaxID=53444 RepID=A0A0R2JNM4_9LACO|nr:SH3 domain-containing protein [Fructilactobacillus lindneri]ANZ57791.1 hypothetical protein AYR60_02920 [Fructilactobacillus lindneri]ANZ59060.1 hypothetical protein AYR59_02920 [Fructilactobacillus lindneri]KRN78768.1 muramidase [Fructilactobacillus lindneri DSM 20690 = JCM 11027]POG98113.1 hypothetical protein BGL31_03250 [Fructilactobacillus lindneri]POH01772.1 hypothetical protein BGL32_04180 [Fructilactobacillus lindneri]
MNKFTKAHNKMALATGETKTRTKLTKSKHGWLKIAMGITFASTSLFAVGHTTHAETQPSVQANVASTTTNNNDNKTVDAPKTNTIQDTADQATDASAVKDDAVKTTDANKANDSQTAPVKTDDNQVNTDAAKTVTSDSAADKIADAAKPAETNQSAASVQTDQSSQSVDSPAKTDAPVKTTDDSQDVAPVAQTTDPASKAAIQTTDAKADDSDKVSSDKQTSETKAAKVSDDVATDKAADNTKADDSQKSDVKATDTKADDSDKVSSDKQTAETKAAKASDDVATDKTADNTKADDSQKSDVKATDTKTDDSDKVSSDKQTVDDIKADDVATDKTADATKADDSQKSDDQSNDNADDNDEYQITDRLGDESDEDNSAAMASAQAALASLKSQSPFMVLVANNSNTAGMTPASGTYTLSGTQNVRDGAGTNYNITGQLNAGDSINYDGTKNADGYTWVHYQNYEGLDRWVAQIASANTSHQAFISSLSAGAIETWKKYGVLPSVSIAQAIVESAWGQSAPGNNLFGIKGSYQGQSTTQKTQEYLNGHYVTIYDQFRAYPSYTESILDHGSFLAVNSRYANLIGSRDYAQVCSMLQSDGYATSPTYASTLISVIRSNNLSQYDQNLDNPTQGANNPDNGSTNVVPANGTWTFSTDTNVRTAPSLSGSVVGMENTGTKITYDGLADNNGYTWMRFKDGSGAERYAAQIGANADVPATPAPETPTAPAANNNGGATTNNSGSYTLPNTQNVRNDASLNAGITGQLEPGYTVNYDGTKDADGYTWLHYNNYAGADRWVANMGSTAPAATPAPETPTAPVVNNNDGATTNNSGSYTLAGTQNVRDGASLNAGITGQLEPGYTVNYDGTKEADGYTWLHYTNYAGATRWVAQIGASTAAPAAPVATTNNSGSYTLAGDQNVRDGASLNAGVTGQLHAGDTVNYDGTKEADGYIWLHYTNYAGATRWVAQINATPAATPAPAATVNNQGGNYTLSGDQNVRSSANVGNNVTGQLHAGDTIAYDKTQQSDGYTWLHYNNYAGQDRWIAQMDSIPATTELAVSNGSVSQQALKIATSLAGTKYVYGGSNPQTGFDCSGLIYYAYQKAGKTLPRHAAGQYGATTRISKAQARPGDLVFFQDGSGIYHDGFYLGNDKMLDAQNRGVVYNDLLSYFSGSVYFGRVN